MWHVIGNGPGEVTLNKGEKIIRFNQSLDRNKRTDLIIKNSKLAGIDSGYFLQGKVPFLHFEDKLAENEKVLATILGCKPSLGLLTIKTMVEHNIEIKVSGMNLLPSLQRSLDYSHRKALPAAYHNWLGERRLALSLGHKLNWSSVFMLPIPKKVGNGSPSLAQLACLPNLSKNEARQIWQDLSMIPYHLWLHQVDSKKLELVESIFYISRDTNLTPNWWMYDNQISTYVSKLHKTLAIVQQILFQKNLKLP